MKRYLEIEKIVYQELEKNCFGNKKRQGYRHLFGVYMIIPFIKTIPHLITLNFQVNLLERC